MDFSHAYTGYEAFSSEGLTLSGHPYEQTQGCLGSYTLALDRLLTPEDVDVSKLLEVDVEVGALGAQHQIVRLQDPDWVDVAFSSELDQALADGDDVDLTAVLVTSAGEDVQDWGEEWMDRDKEQQPDLIDDGGQKTDASFRICLRQIGPCAEEPEIFTGLTEIRIVLANAGLSSTVVSAVRGKILLIGGTVEGWEAEDFKLEPPQDNSPP